MGRLICVQPADKGWAVRFEGLENDMLFISGAKAEAAARKLARKLAVVGEAIEIKIFLRDGSLAACFTVPASGQVA